MPTSRRCGRGSLGTMFRGPPPLSIPKNAISSDRAFRADGALVRDWLDSYFGEAGRGARRRYRTAASRWRRRVLWRIWWILALLLLAGLALPVVSGAGLWPDLGLSVGALIGALIALLDSPPHRIELWRTGYEGERKTARALAPLSRSGSVVSHDLPDRREDGRSFRGNVDHVVVSPGGVFVLDTKWLGATSRSPATSCACAHRTTRKTPGSGRALHARHGGSRCGCRRTSAARRGSASCRQSSSSGAHSTPDSSSAKISSSSTASVSLTGSPGSRHDTQPSGYSKRRRPSRLRARESASFTNGDSHVRCVTSCSMLPEAEDLEAKQVRALRRKDRALSHARSRSTRAYPPSRLKRAGRRAAASQTPARRCA